MICCWLQILSMIFILHLSQDFLGSNFHLIFLLGPSMNIFGLDSGSDTRIKFALSFAGCGLIYPKSVVSSALTIRFCL